MGPAQPALTVLLLVSVLAAGADVWPQDRLIGYPPRTSLKEISVESLDDILDLLSNTLEEKTLPSGEKTVVSRLVAPTLQANDSVCQIHTKLYWQGITGDELWPKLMLDATGKIPDGILVGNVNVFGSYDECLYIDVTLDPSKHPSLPGEARHFVGRYVPVLVLANAPLPAADGTFHGSAQQVQEQEERLGGAVILPMLGLGTGFVGMCVPSSCSSEDVRAGIQSFVGSNFTVVALPSSTSKDSVELRSGDIVVIVIMALVGALMAAGTLLDLYDRGMLTRFLQALQVTSASKSPNAGMKTKTVASTSKSQEQRPQTQPVSGTGRQALIAFSVYTNTKKLLDTTPGKGTLTCLHGIRFFSMTWVVLGHAASAIQQIDQNFMVAIDWIKGPLFQPVVNGTPSVDTFFLLSGVLLAYGFCNAYEKTKTFNLPMFYLHRYLRLTPLLAIVIAICATWYVHLGEGPLWPLVGLSFQPYCQKYWWRDLFYIQNFFEFGDMCVGQSWYLANDMQMFVFSPLILLPLVWRPLFGILWLCLLIVGFSALRVVIWSVKDLPPSLSVLNPDRQDILLENYVYPWMRCTVWLLGIGLGYLLHRLRGRKVVLKPWVWLPGWIAAIATGIAVIYGMTPYQMPWTTASKAVAVSYGGLHRLAWGFAVSWVIFACVTGYGGFINAFLSYSGFVPFSRLTYAGYLVHLNVIYFSVYSSMGTLYFDVMRLIYWILSQMIVSFAVAYVFSISFEAPFVTLEKLAFQTPQNKTKPGDGADTTSNDASKDKTAEPETKP